MSRRSFLATGASAVAAGLAATGPAGVARPAAAPRPPAPGALAIRAWVWPDV